MGSQSTVQRGSWAVGKEEPDMCPHPDCPIIGENPPIMKRPWSLSGTGKSNSAFLSGVALGKSFGPLKYQIPHL